MSLGLKKRYLMSLVQSGGVSPRLPSAYQEVEWIASNGASGSEGQGDQWINTGHNPSVNCSAEYKFSYQAISTYGRHILACMDNTPKNYLFPAFRTLSSSRLFAQRGGDQLQTSPATFTENTIYEVKAWRGNNDIIVNGTKLATLSGTSGVNAPLYIFALNENGVADFRAKATLYYMKIYEGDTLVRDFVPCYRKSDNEIGLYDLVNDVFYTNQGSGSFTCGVPIIYDSRYQQVEYIESSGTQYIDTGIYQLNDKKIELSFKATTTNQTGTILGKYDDTTQRFGFDIESGYFVYTKHRLSGGWTNIQTADTNKHRIVFDNPNLTFIFDNSNYSMTNVIASTQRSLTLFAYGSSTIQELFTGQIFDVKIYESGTKVREFIPVYRRSDNEIGLLDIVNDVFYTNQGSGSFTMGSAV